MNMRVDRTESEYLWREYSRIPVESPPLDRFLTEIYATMRREIDFGPDDSLVDVGCGRGYFLEFLARRGHRKAQGVDPCKDLVDNRVSEAVSFGGFEENGFADQSFDVSFCCHTLHHLPDADPVAAIRELLRLTRRHVVIVEINNTNLPMLLVSAWNRSVERNAMRYNRQKVVSMMERAGAAVAYQGEMESGYISGDSLLYRFLATIGSRPYNIVIGSRKS